MAKAKQRTITRQKAFDRAAQRIYRQGGPSVSGDAGGCAYRGNDVRRCAVGEFILERDYEESMEGMTADQVYRKGILPRLPGRAPEDFWRDLQRQHDNAVESDLLGADEFFPVFAASMRAFTKRRHLNASVIGRLEAKRTKREAATEGRDQ